MCIRDRDKAGFDLEQDPGVPYLSNFSFCGVQSGFDRTQAVSYTQLDVYKRQVQKLIRFIFGKETKVLREIS